MWNEDNLEISLSRLAGGSGRELIECLLGPSLLAGAERTRGGAAGISSAQLSTRGDGHFKLWTIRSHVSVAVIKKNHVGVCSHFNKRVYHFFITYTNLES